MASGLAIVYRAKFPQVPKGGFPNTYYTAHRDVRAEGAKEDNPSEHNFHNLEEEARCTQVKLTRPKIMTEMGKVIPPAHYRFNVTPLSHHVGSWKARR